MFSPSMKIRFKVYIFSVLFLEREARQKNKVVNESDQLNEKAINEGLFDNKFSAGIFGKIKINFI